MRISPDASATVRLNSLPSPLAFEYARQSFSINRARIVHLFWYGLSAAIGMITLELSRCTAPPPA